MTNSDLPCAGKPCPWGSACCQYGVDLKDDERAQIVAEHGDSAVLWIEEELDAIGWRTAVKNGMCVFHDPNGPCKIHDKPYYPSCCKRYPFDGYEYAAEECPFARDKGISNG